MMVGSRLILAALFAYQCLALKVTFVAKFLQPAVVGERGAFRSPDGPGWVKRVTEQQQSTFTSERRVEYMLGTFTLENRGQYGFYFADLGSRTHVTCYIEGDERSKNAAQIKITQVRNRIKAIVRGA